MINEIHPWIYTILLGLASLLIIANNIWNLTRSRIKNESTSLTLFIGAILGMVAMLSAPDERVKYLAFLPILIDPGAGYTIYSILKNLNK